MDVPEGVAFNDDSSWLDSKRAKALAVPKVGAASVETGAWGALWVWFATNDPEGALVRIVYNSDKGHWDGVDVHLTFGDGGHIVPLPEGCTEIFVGYKNGSGTSFLVKGN
jgi:hypothetical protein